MFLEDKALCGQSDGKEVLSIDSAICLQTKENVLALDVIEVEVTANIFAKYIFADWKKTVIHLTNTSPTRTNFY